MSEQFGHFVIGKEVIRHYLWKGMRRSKRGVVVDYKKQRGKSGAGGFVGGLYLIDYKDGGRKYWTRKADFEIVKLIEQNTEEK